MKQAKVREIFSVHIISGFLIGILIWLIILSVFFQQYEGGFTFKNFINLHKNTYLFYVIDLFPVAGIFAGIFAGSVRSKSLQLIDRYEKDQVKKSQIINAALQALTIGKLKTTYPDTELDPEIAANLYKLQEKLLENRNAEQRTRESENQRNWTSSGLAEFGDILRSFSDDLEALSYKVISTLVRYMGINQGGFFVVDGESSEKSLRMMACHAYDRRKFPDQVIRWGEGFIGNVAIERKTYYTDKIPDGYLTITSGLGKANPRHLLIVPMVINDEVFGIFELASFDPFEQYKIDFVERLAENTATTLNIMNNNFRTEQLLKETQEQAKMLAQKEEQVRKNNEELKQTQHEAATQSEQFITFTNTVNHTLIRAEYDTNGKLLYANTRFLKKLGYSGNREVRDKHISLFVHEDDRMWFEGMWKKLAAGGEHFEGYMRLVTKLGLDLWTVATYTCARKEDGDVDKILFLAIEFQEQKANSQAADSRISAFNQVTYRAEFGLDGRALLFNQLFLKSLKYSEHEAKDKNIFDFFLSEDQEMFNEIWEQVIAGKGHQGQMRIIGKFESEQWYSVSFSTITDIYGEIERILLLAHNISKERELEYSLRERNELLQNRGQQFRLEKLDYEKQAEEALERLTLKKDELHERLIIFTNFFSKLPYPAIAINNQSFVIFANKSAEKFFTFKLKALLRQSISELMPLDQDDDLIRRFVDPSLSLQEVAEKRLKIKLKNNQLLEAPVTIMQVELQKELVYILLAHKN